MNEAFAEVCAESRHVKLRRAESENHKYRNLPLAIADKIASVRIFAHAPAPSSEAQEWAVNGAPAGQTANLQQFACASQTCGGMSHF